jgi:hypothetical protein
MNIDRRSALMLGAAMTAAAIPARPAQAQPFRDQAENPVLFWHQVSLDLVALDHSIDPAESRAPGPCASARALAVAHAVIADAASLVGQAYYRPQFYRGKAEFDVSSPALFIGGAAAGILAHIYSAPIHAYTIEASRDKFQRILGSNGGKDWQAGLAFSAAPEFRGLWRWDEMRTLLLPQFATYIPGPRRHNIDPYNASQGSYGSGWGDHRPLVLDGPRQMADLAPAPPPEEGSPEYEHDLAEVRVKGALVSKSDGDFSARTPEETNIGLFWAYDGPRLLGTPPRLYNQIIRKIAIDDELDWPTTARLFALCNIAMADAGNVCWWAKYRYKVWRPVLGIQNHRRHPVVDWQPFGAPRTNPTRFALGLDLQCCDTAQSLMGGGSPAFAFGDYPGRYFDSRPRPQRGAGEYRDAAFTPNFPGYPSGHATFGGACFEMLKLVRRELPHTREDPDRIKGPFISDELNGISTDHFQNRPRPFVPISYNSIDQMIEENDLSRIFLGIHWRFDCNRGSHSGRRIAKAIHEAAYELGERGAEAR